MISVRSGFLYAVMVITLPSEDNSRFQYSGPNAILPTPIPGNTISAPLAAGERL